MSLDCVDTCRIERNGGKEQLRVSAREFKGRLYAELRVWFLNADGVWCPTSKGITVRMSEVREAARALDKTIDCVGVDGHLEAV